jgi:hypothetical protein
MSPVGTHARLLATSLISVGANRTKNGLALHITAFGSRRSLGHRGSRPLAGRRHGGVRGGDLARGATAVHVHKRWFASGNVQTNRIRNQKPAFSELSRIKKVRPLYGGKGEPCPEGPRCCAYYVLAFWPSLSQRFD